MGVELAWGGQGHLPFGEDFGESGTQQKHHFTSYERDSESGGAGGLFEGYRLHSPSGSLLPLGAVPFHCYY
jgi:hypothetical protein